MIELVDEFLELVDDILWAGSVFGICGLDGQVSGLYGVLGGGVYRCDDGSLFVCLVGLDWTGLDWPLSLR